jgi:ABC-type bacteriocin/lantibiotic exporter with double-glycine peptidase domain
MNAQRQWLVPEQVQTSAMDCGPAALVSLLAGHGITVSYGRLREACQTSVDGTSIDTLEEVAVALGLEAEQTMQPVDFLPRAEAAALPALAVVTLPSGVTHFVVIWSRIGSWIQVMDPAVGRRWRRWDRVARELYLHEMPVPAEDWRDWAMGTEAHATWGRAMHDLDIDSVASAELIAQAVAATGWRSLATLDAAIRLAGTLVRAGGIIRGKEARDLIMACLEPAITRDELPHDMIPARYWFARPGPPELVGAEGEEMVLIRGAVLVRVRGLRPSDTAPPDLSPELAAALNEPPPQPGRLVLQMLGRDGWLPLGLIVLAMVAAAAAITTEALLFKEILQSSTPLLQSQQRGGAFLAILIFLVALSAVDLLGASLARLVGRRLEIRLRIALLEKIPHLGSRYFHSRLVSDMAGRAHGLRSLRTLPVIIAGIIQTGFQILLTTAGLIWLNPHGAAFALLFTAAFVMWTMAMTPAMSEREHRVQTHNGVLSQIYLDALLGLTPLRLHGAERSMQREHEQILSSWWRAGSQLAFLSASGQAGATLIYTIFAIAQVVVFINAGGSSELVLLLLYWIFSLPGLAQSMTALIQQYPGLRTRVLTLIEPLGAPDEDVTTDDVLADSAPAPGVGGVAITLTDVMVQAGGHTILDGLNLTITPGEQIAVVGPSGAGKSSLVGLLLGWHTPAAGRCELDGYPLDGTAITSLRRSTAWVDPAVQLWNRSLMANLTYGQPDGIVRPLVFEQAELLNLLERLPSGMQTLLGEGGGLVSGGEGQRVRLGRALGHPGPRLVILDEPFRGLDRTQRAGLLARARDLWAGATMLCITHDVAETLSFLRVLVIEEGQIVEDGAPVDLAADLTTRYRVMLDAEERVAREGWGNPAWRRVHLADGVLSEEPVPS